MSEILVCSNNEIPSDLDFSGIHYFNNNYFQKNILIIAIGGEKTKTEWYETLNGEAISEEVTVREVVGVVSLAQSPYDENIVWLNYIEVHPEHQGKGIAKKLTIEVSSVMSGLFSNKILQRSSVSDYCPKHMTSKFDQWYDELGVKWIQERDGGLASNNLVKRI